MSVIPIEKRYSVISEKNPREIVLLRGIGCQWKRCRFCDYHLDFCEDEMENYWLNCRVLERVTGCYRKLEVINSGSFVDLDNKTMQEIRQICLQKGITELHFECHWMHRNEILALKARLAKERIHVKVKIGVETFDRLFRESYLNKGIDEESPQKIAEYFDEVCLLQGLPGQTATSMQTDIKIGLRYFERVCVNIMQNNSKSILADPRVIRDFQEQIYPLYINNPRVDILLHNTDFGVGI